MARRPRPRRQLFFYVQHRGNAALLWFLLTCMVVAVGLVVVDWRLRPQIQEWAKSRARYVSAQVINESISEELQENAADYEGIVRIEKNDAGKIMAVQTDMVKINGLKARIIDRVTAKLKETTSITIRMPLGNAFGSDLFFGRGPRLPIQLMPLGSANADFISVFTDGGINQTRHQILLEVSVELSVLAPGSESTVTTTSKVAIAETVLVGTVPNSYTYLDGSAFQGLAQGNYKNLTGDQAFLPQLPPEEQRKTP